VDGLIDIAVKECGIVTADHVSGLCFHSFLPVAELLRVVSEAQPLLSLLSKRNATVSVIKAPRTQIYHLRRTWIRGRESGRI